MVDAFTKLLTALATFLGAIAWPVTTLIIVLLFRREFQSALSKLSGVLDRTRKVAIPGVALELDRIADAAVEDADKGGKITPGQIEAAARIAAQTDQIGSEQLLYELDRLCLEYDSLRRALPSGNERTRAMTRVVVKMRSLAPSVVNSLATYQGSGSPGSRLAAIAIMQMVPRAADIDWLRERFLSETQPFLLYHASLALQNIANISDTPEKKKRLRLAAEEALNKIKGFPGVPDPGTVQVLEMLLSSLRASS